MLTKFIVCFIAGIGAGLGTGFAGMSAAAVVSPMLITFLHMPAYEAVGIALASDVLASAVSAYTYGKNKNLDIRNGIVMMFYPGRKLHCKPRTKPGHGRLLGIHDLSFGRQIHRKTCHDNQGSHGRDETAEKTHPIYYLRRGNRLYLRFYRSGRRYDDASDPYKRSGI